MALAIGGPVEESWIVQCCVIEAQEDGIQYLDNVHVHYYLSVLCWCVSLF